MCLKRPATRHFKLHTTLKIKDVWVNCYCTSKLCEIVVRVYGILWLLFFVCIIWHQITFQFEETLEKTKVQHNNKLPSASIFPQKTHFQLKLRITRNQNRLPYNFFTLQQSKVMLQIFAKSNKILSGRFQTLTIVSKVDKRLKFKSIHGDKNDCTLYKITPRNAINFIHLSSCGTIVLKICENVLNPIYTGI